MTLCEGLRGGGDRINAFAQKLEGNRLALRARCRAFPTSSTLQMPIIVEAVVSDSYLTQLSATDVSARTTMKGAAKCDEHCELQNSVNQQVLERILRSRDIPGSMPASVSTSFHTPAFA